MSSIAMILWLPGQVVGLSRTLTGVVGLLQDSKGNTPLHYAAGYGRIDIIEPLLEAGCSGRAANSKGHTPYELVK